MRLDKFLKNARLIKRRTIAKEACEQGRVTINDKIAKPGSEVKVCDLIRITYGQRVMAVEVVQLLEHAQKDMATEMYRMIE
ncbi:RNA-binding S4 domain-containing protein [Lutibacter sp. B2]|nr:RNA-binding S4 domain-containing protein [Lutibacter sp. B2]